jgi:hypothetical protein
MPPSNFKRTSSKKRNSSNLQVPKFQNSDSKINLNDYEEVEDEYGFRYMRKKQKLLLSLKQQQQQQQQQDQEKEKSYIKMNTSHIDNDLNDHDDDEEDCVTSTPVPKNAKVVISASSMVAKPSHLTSIRSNEAFSPSTPTPSKQILENARKKRRSSFATNQSATSTVRNSFGISLMQSSLPPNNVKTVEYHRHLQPDLPGPVKMRQLLIWACKKAASDRSENSASSEKLVEALLNNEINTSWYQRPITAKDSSDENSSIYYLPNPQNQELSECIDLYKNYHMKLEAECQTWETLKSSSPASSILNLKQTCLLASNSSAPKIDTSLNQLFADELQHLNKWIHSLPMSVDRLDWNTKLALSFQDHAKQFCEGVFHQIFAKFFSSDLIRSSNKPRSSNKSGSAINNNFEPMMILRALSTNQQN